MARSLMEQRRFEPVIDQVYPATEAAAAFAHVLTGQKLGNVVIEFDPA